LAYPKLFSTEKKMFFNHFFLPIYYYYFYTQVFKISSPFKNNSP
jgi:hypothetical protein